MSFPAGGVLMRNLGARFVARVRPMIALATLAAVALVETAGKRWF